MRTVRYRHHPENQALRIDYGNHIGETVAPTARCVGEFSPVFNDFGPTMRRVNLVP
jgi:hypothetical protein